MRRGAPPWALVAVLLLLVSSCAGADQPAPDNAAVSARYENQARADAAPEAPARPEASAPARVQPAPAAATPAPATNRVVETPKPAPAATPSQADSSASRSPEAPRAAPQSPPPLSSPTPPPLDTTLPPPDPNSGAPLTLSDCVRLAAERSPYLKGPALEVEIRKLDEKDAWYKLFPNLNFLLTSDRFVSGQETKYRKKGDTYNSLGLSSGSYNPIAAWVQHDAQKDVTRLARMGQTLALQELILQLANAFVALDNLDRQIAVRREMIDLAEKGLVYATRLENVQTSQIDIKIARQRLSMAHAEYEYLLAARTQAVLGLKDLIGLPAYERVTLDVGQFRDQELPRYKADGYDLDYAMRNSLRMRMQEVRTALAAADVKAQWVKFMPTFNFMLRKPDQVNTGSNINDNLYYLTTYVSFPIWQWGESLRAVDKAKLRQQGTDTNNEIDRLKFSSSWAMQKMQVLQQRTLMRLSEDESALAGLSLQKALTEYNAGKITYKQLLDANLGLLMAQMKANDLLKNYQSALLQLVSDTGDLLKRFVDIEGGVDE